LRAQPSHAQSAVQSVFNDTDTIGLIVFAVALMIFFYCRQPVAVPARLSRRPLDTKPDARRLLDRNDRWAI
jgi:hypothetical protein